MDPYRILGVSRGCTRKELKDAFRARALSAHPDRGGEPAEFIRLHAAYDQIRAELSRKTMPPLVDLSTHPARRGRPRKQADPNWEPDLILVEGQLPRLRPAQPPGPNWQPDLVIVDDRPTSEHPGPTANPQLWRQNYIAWVRHVSFRTRHRVPLHRRRWFNAMGTTILVTVMVYTIGICWAVWTDDPQTKGIDAVTWLFSR